MSKVVLITGAYGGLGKALSILLSSRGYTLVLGGRNKEELEKLAKQLNATMMVIDVRKKQECERFIEESVKKHGRIDVLINNAGAWKASKIEDIEEEDVREMFDVNVIGPIFLCQAAVKIMKKQGFGHILNIGSTAAIDNRTSHLAYGSSKAALISLTGCLRAELENTGILVTVFSPSGMRTGLFKPDPGRKTDNYMDPSYVAEKVVEHMEHPTEWHVILRK